MEQQPQIDQEYIDDEHEYIPIIRNTIAQARERIVKEMNVQIVSNDPQEKFVQQNSWLAGFITDLTTIDTYVQSALEGRDPISTEHLEEYKKIKSRIDELRQRVKELKEQYPNQSGQDNLPTEVKEELLEKLDVLDDK